METAHPQGQSGATGAARVEADGRPAAAENDTTTAPEHVETAGPDVESAAEEAAARGLPVVAFFDIDNTLLHGASLLFLASAARKLGIVGLRDLIRYGWQGIRFRRRGENLRVLDQVADRGIRMLTGLPAERLHALADEVVQRIRPRLWPETKALLTEHVKNGHQVWLVSATPDFLAQEIALSLGATGGLGTPLEIEDGVFTGRFAGPAMHGAQKGVAAHELLEKAGFDPADCYAYSDSINDLPLLGSVGTAIVVNPDRALAAHAAERGWRVLRLDPSSIRAERRRVRKQR